MKQILILLLLIWTTPLSAQWTQTGDLLEGGTITCLIDDGTDVIAGTESGGIYKSIDEGSTWSFSSDGLTNYQIKDLEKIGGRFLAATYGGGVFVSDDGGSTWSASNTGFPGEYCEALGRHAGRVFATSGIYIYASDNQGDSWSLSSSGLNGGGIFSIVSDGNVVYAGTHTGGIYKSTNNGLTWVAANSGLPIDLVRSIVVHLGVVYAVVMNEGLFRSDNQGDNWSQVALPSLGLNPWQIAESSDGLYVCTFDPSGGQGGVFKSVDGGLNWSQMNLPGGFHSFYSIQSSGVNVFAGGSNDIGIFKSGNSGQNWVEANNGLTARYVRAVALSDDKFYCGGTGYLLVSSNMGTNWNQINTGFPPQSRSIHAEGTNVYVGYGSADILYSNNSGVNWAMTTTQTPTNMFDADIKSNGSIVFGAGGSVAGRSTDFGANWTEVSSGLPFTFVNCLEIIDQYAFIGSSSRVYRMALNGTSWTSSGLVSEYVLDLANDGVNLFAGTLGGDVFKSSDYGDSWQNISSNLPNARVTSLTCAGGYVFAGLQGFGVYVSDDNGSSWEPDGASMNYQSVLELSSNGTHILAGTGGNGVWKRDVPSGSIVISGQVNYGNVIIGESPSLNFEIENQGTSDLIIYGVDYPYPVFSGNWSGVIPPGGSHTVSVVFSPQSVGDFSGEALVSSSAVGGGAFTISGFGTATPTPQINLSTGSLTAGNTIDIFGVQFTSNGSVDLVISGPDNFVFAQTLSVDSQGDFSYDFSTTLGMPEGTYNVVATDETTELSTIVKTFVLVNPAPPLYHLNILDPVTSTEYEVGDNVTLSFTDVMQLDSEYPMNGAMRIYDYDVEYSDDGGSNWTYFTNISGDDFPTITINETSSFTANAIGSYQFRVTDTYQPLNTQTSGIFDVVMPQVDNIHVTQRWDHSYSNQNNPLQGVAADGTSRIYIEVSKIDNNIGPAIESVSVNLSDNVSSATTHLGKVMAASQIGTYSSEANSANQITASTSSNQNNGYWFWYVAPDDFTRPGQGDDTESYRTVTAEITITYAGGSSEVIPEVIKIVRPPLMLVHGLGGNYQTTFANFRNNSSGFSTHFLNDNRFEVAHSVRLYEHYNFSVNALALVQTDNSLYPAPYFTSFQDVIKDMRSKGYASTQVDYIAHSMGGAVIRTVLDNFYTRFTRTGNHSNLDYKNYEEGYVNKIITISTPHNSSPLADIVDRYIGDLTYLMRLGLTLYYDQNPNAMAFNMVQPNFNNTGLIPVPVYEATDAVRNLKIDESNGGVNHGMTDLPTHLIAADVWPGTQPISNFAIPQSLILEFQNVVDQFDFLDKLLNVTLAGAVDPGLTSDLSEAASLMNKVHRAMKYLEIMMSTYNVAVFIPESDLVVPIESQLADYPKTAPNVSVFDDKLTHCCFGKEVLNQLEVGNEVMNMLNAPISSSAFASIPSTSNKTTPVNNILSAPTMAFSSDIDYDFIELLSPESGAPVYVDSTLTITVDIRDTTDLIKTDVTFQGKSYRLAKNQALEVLSVQVSPFALDTQMIFVEALYKNQDSARFVYDTTSVVVSTLSNLHQIKVEPEILFLMKQETQYPKYYAVYDEFTTSVRSFSQRITATVDDPSIAVFEPKTKGFKGVSDGETFATISYDGFTDTIYLVVRRELNPSVINGLEEIVRDDVKDPVIHVYPNPSKNLITITTNQEGEYTINMYNSIGQLLQSQTFSGVTQTMSIRDYSEGIYLLEVTEKTGLKHMVKVVKQ